MQRRQVTPIILSMRAWIFIWLLASLNIIALACGSETPTPTPPIITPTLPAQDDPASLGHALFVSTGCAACHGQNAEGTGIAPALAGHSEQMVERQVRSPRFQMPSFSQEQVSDEELEAIAHYITSLEGDDHAHPDPIDLTAVLEMHHWMALEALKAGNGTDATHHVVHIVELLEEGEHRNRMEAILESPLAGDTHVPEHEIEEMLAGTAKPDLTLVQLHLRQALVALAVEDVADAQHHVAHFQELATSMEEEQAAEILDLLHQGDRHQAEHEMQELLGEEEDHN